MANRIVVTDGNWQDDNLVLVPRQQLPMTVGNLPAGDYLVVNTLTGPDTATATNSPTAAPWRRGPKSRAPACPPER